MRDLNKNQILTAETQRRRGYIGVNPRKSAAKKGFLCVSVSLWLLFFTLFTCIGQSDAAQVSITPSSTQANIESTVTLTVQVDQVAGLAGFQFNYSFDTVVLEVSSVTINSGFDQIVLNEFDNVNGVGLVSAVALSSPALSGTNLSLATIDFLVKGTGTFNIGLANVILGNAIGEEIPSTAVGGTITSIVLDTTATTTTASPAGGTYTSAQSVTLTCNDGTGSGCDKIYYTTDGTTPTTSSTVYTGPISISATTTLKFFAKDLAGNSEAVKTETYTIDTTAPTGTISINSGSASTSSATATLTLSCTDTSGCSEMRFSNDNSTWSTAETYATSKAWTLTSGDGTKTVYVKFKDGAGNWSSVYSANITLDTVEPVFTPTAPATNGYTNTATVGYALSEAVASGNITFTQTGGTADGSSPHVYNFTASDMTSGSHTVNTGFTLVSGAIYTVNFDATDAAGNTVTTVANSNITYDTTSASATITSPASSSVVNNPKVGYTLSEGVSSGNIIFTATGGNADAASPHTYTLAGAELAAGVHSVTTGITLVDGAIYTVSIENVFDAAGNATATVSNTSVTYDSTSVAITNTTPAANSSIADATVSYTLTEQAQNGKVTFTWAGGTVDSGSPHVYTLSGSDLYPGSHTVNTSQSLVDGTFYTVTFEATDMAGNPATTVSNAMIYYDSQYGIGPVGNVDNTGPSANRVDGYDLIKMALSFGARPGDPNWIPSCDLDKNLFIDGNDMMILGVHFGDTGQ